MLRNVTLVYAIDVHTFYLVMKEHWTLQRYNIGFIFMYFTFLLFFLHFFVITTFLSSRMQFVVQRVYSALRQ